MTPGDENVLLPRPLLWAQMRREQFQEALARGAVVILPVGSIEQHGPHCPVDVDVSIPVHLATEASKLIDDFPVVVAPPVTFGFTHYNQGHPGTITLELETFIALVSQVTLGIYRNGFERVVLLNGHGGNHHPLKAIAVKVAEHGLIPLALSHWDLVDEGLEWWQANDPDIGHAGEWETSLQLYLRPELVDESAIVADDWLPSVSERFARTVQFPERLRETSTGVMGDATIATAEKGRRYVEYAASRLVELVRAFHAQPPRRYREKVESD